ncbi:MAG: MFS transporter [Gammaproteobacteria bacterium]|nr:MFS transporter [Gammaproteobacteria bacterium]
MNKKQPNLLSRFMKTASQIESNELRSVLLAFALVFTLMAAWYILRPVRDAMASEWTDTEVSFLWNINFLVSVFAVAIYGFAVSKVKFKYLVPGVYGFFAASFVAFYFGVSGVEDRVLIDKIFYVWVSVFSLFHISVFWSFMSDLFTKEQSNRLFAFIAAGSSAGALIGPLIPALFADDLGTDTLMLIAAVVLIFPIGIVLYLERLKVVDLHNEVVHADLSAAKIGGNPFAGFKMFVTNPYLLAIGAFILLYTAIGSFVYFEQKNLLAQFIETRAERTEVLAMVDWVVNILTFAIGMFATGRIVERFGMAVTLSLVPFVIAAGLLVLAFAPLLTVVLVLQVVRRAGNYAITRPSREMLFTAVDRETRFKAKPVIDIAVYRGGDAVSSIAFAGLTDGVGLGLGAMAAVGAGIAALWGVVGRYLGRMFTRMDIQKAPLKE